MDKNWLSLYGIMGANIRTASPGVVDLSTRNPWDSVLAALLEGVDEEPLELIRDCG